MLAGKNMNLMAAAVPRWGKGAERITALIEARHLQRVTGDPDTVAALLASARRHIDSARRSASQDPEAAYSLAYDAARKSATALLSHQGLRPTTVGGHLVVVEAIRAQFPGVPGLTSLDRLRRRRNQAEYPDPRSYDPITPEEADDAIKVASDCVASTERLLELDELGVF
jgi:HEPN domain-containing protein